MDNTFSFFSILKYNNLPLFSIQFITCPSVSKSGGPIISIASTATTSNDVTSSRDNNDDVSEAILSWMAGFHPDKSPDRFTVFVNGVASENQVHLFISNLFYIWVLAVFYISQKAETLQKMLVSHSILKISTSEAFRSVSLV